MQKFFTVFSSAFTSPTQNNSQNRLSGLLSLRSSNRTPFQVASFFQLDSHSRNNALSNGLADVLQSSSTKSAWYSLLFHHFKALENLSLAQLSIANQESPLNLFDKVVQAFDAQHKVVDSLLTIFNDQNGGNPYTQDPLWLNSLMHQIFVDYRRLGKLCENQYSSLPKHLKKKGAEFVGKYSSDEIVSFPFLSEVIQQLGRFNRKCMMDRSKSKESNRKQCILTISIQLFQCYFQVDNIGLAQKTVQTILSPAIYPIEDFPFHQQLSFYYFQGRIHIFSGDYIEADAILSKLFRLTPLDCFFQRREILAYIIPLKLMMGKFPSVSLLKYYNLYSKFSHICRSLGCGNVASFEKSLEILRPFFAQRGMLLLVQSLILYCWSQCLLTAFKSSHQLALSNILNVFRLASNNPDMTKLQVECILTNLICSKKIRGYIAHQYDYLILSKANAYTKSDLIFHETSNPQLPTIQNQRSKRNRDGEKHSNKYSGKHRKSSHHGKHGKSHPHRKVKH